MPFGCFDEQARTPLDEITGLGEWLADQGLEKHGDEVIRWCREQGAATLLEVAENAVDLAEALPSLTPSERGLLESPAAAQAAELVVARARSRELETLLIKVVRHLTEDQLQVIEADLNSQQRSTILRLATSCVAPLDAAPPLADAAGTPTAVPRVALAAPAPLPRQKWHMGARDRQLLRLAARNEAPPQGATDKCAGCGYDSWNCRKSQEDGGLYCQECWRLWEEQST